MQTERILIVDDREDNLYLLQTLLQGYGYEVITAPHGVAALDLARQNPPALIIADILMPVMDGFALCREWKQDAQLAPIPFIFYTATYTDEQDRRFALNLGAQQFIVKPEEPEVLLAIIRETLQQSQSAPAASAEIPTETPEAEVGVLRQYNQALIRKLEGKMEQLEQDIAERKRAEGALRASEERYRTILQAALDGFCMTDLQGRLLEVNEANCRMTGYSRQELLAMRISDLGLAETQVETAAHMQRIIAVGQERFQTQQQRKDGSIFDVEVSVQYQPIDGGRLVTFLRDITERKLREEALRTSRAQLSTALQMACAGYWEYDVDRDLFTFNDDFYRIFRITADAVGGYQMSAADYARQFCHPDDAALVALETQAAIDTTDPGYSRQIEHRCLFPDGQSGYIIVRFFVVKDASGRTVRTYGVNQDITERKLAEQELAAQYRVLRVAGSMARFGGWSVNLATSRCTWSDVVAEIHEMPLGFSPTAEEGISFYAPEWRERITQVFTDCAQKGLPYDEELEIITRTGKRRWVRTTGEAVRDEQGAIVQVQGAFQDITERKRAQEALRASEEKLRTVIDATPFPVAVVDLQDDQVNLWSRSALTLFGHTAPTAQEWYQIAYPDPDYRAEVLKQWKPALEVARQSGQAVNTGEYRVTCNDGSIRICELYAAFIADNLIVTFNDITERKLAEEALQESEERFEQLFNHMADGVAVYHAVDDGQDFVVVDLNKPGQSLSHVKLDEIVGRRITEVFPAVEQMGLLDILRRVWRTGQPEELPLTQYTDGRITEWVENYVYKLPSGLIVAIYADTSEKHRAQEQKEDLERQLQQAQKMESVGRLAGGVAHDFNNMLGVILGHTEMSLEQVDPASPLHSSLQEICKAAQRSADLTRQLLAFARKQTAAPKVLDLNATIEGMLKMLHRLIGEDIDLTWSPATDLWPVRVDPSQIDQILANLCVNARDAIDGVGKVIIETGKTVVDEAYQSQHAEAVPGDYVLLSVSDNGCGMDAGILQNLFEPFFTTKDVGKGTGLGLATVYGIVKQNEGFINVYSEPGQGTTFKVFLPRHRGKADQLEAQGAAEPARQGQETILLVEDEVAILKMTTKLLQQQGYTVLPASTPGEAIRLAREHPGMIHLLMTDVVMPEMSGRDLAKNLLSIYPQLKRLFMSGYTADVIAHHGVLDEGVNFIQKPFSTRALAAKVREVLDQE